MKIDHHVHTSKHSPDSDIHPSELIVSARNAGLDGVVITEHDYQWQADELAELQEEAGDLLVLSGVEVSTREAHMLVYGLPDLKDVRAGVKLKRLIEVVRHHDAVVIAAHPYRWGQDFRRIIADVGPHFHGLELVSNNVIVPERLMTAATLGDHPHFAVTGSSDAHEPSVVGCYYSVFPERIHTMADFLVALKNRKSQPGYHPEKHLVSGPIEWTLPAKG